MTNPTGTIRQDNDGVDYLDTAPIDYMLHGAYQEYDLDAIGTTRSKIFATDERHIVNSINTLYQTSFNWGDLRGKEINFFTPDVQNKITRLKFSKVGIYYIAEVVIDEDLDLDLLGELVNIGDMDLREDLPNKDVVYYASKDNNAPLRSFVRSKFSTHKVSFNPSRDVDTTLMHLGEDDFLTPVVIRNYPNHGEFSTLLFNNEVLPAVELKMLTFSKENVLRLLSAETGVALNMDNYITNDTIRVFDPYLDIDKVYNIYTLKRGTEVKYFAAIKPVKVPTITLPGGIGGGDGPIDYPGTGDVHISFRTTAGLPITHSIMINDETFNAEHTAIDEATEFLTSDDYRFRFYSEGDYIYVTLESGDYGAPATPRLVKFIPQEYAKNNIVSVVTEYDEFFTANESVVLDDSTKVLSGMLIPTFPE